MYGPVIVGWDTARVFGNYTAPITFHDGRKLRMVLLVAHLWAFPLLPTGVVLQMSDRQGKYKGYMRAPPSVPGVSVPLWLLSVVRAPHTPVLAVAVALTAAAPVPTAGGDLWAALAAVAAAILLVVAFFYAWFGFQYELSEQQQLELLGSLNIPPHARALSTFGKQRDLEAGLMAAAGPSSDQAVCPAVPPCGVCFVCRAGAAPAGITGAGAAAVVVAKQAPADTRSSHPATARPQAVLAPGADPSTAIPAKLVM